MNDEQTVEIPTQAPDLGAEVTRQMQQTVGRLFQEGIELKARLEQSERRLVAVQEAAERLKAHYESAWMPRPVEPDEGGPVPMKRKAGG